MLYKYYYTSSIRTKTNLKKWLILKFLLCNSKLGPITASLKLSSKHKNVLLNSPFHFKTVKTHTSIPTMTLLLQSNHQLVSSRPVYIGQLDRSIKTSKSKIII